MTPEPRPDHVFARPTPERLALLTALLVPALLLLIDGGRYAGLGAGLAASLLLAGFINRVRRPARLVQLIVQLLAVTLALGLLTLYAGPARHHFGLYVTIGGLSAALPQLWWRADPRGAALALTAGLVALMGLARAVDRPLFAAAVALYLVAGVLSTRVRDPHQPPLRRHLRGALAPLALALAIALALLAGLGWALPEAEPAVTRALSPYLFGGAGTSGFGEGRIALGERGRITLDDAVKLRVEGPPVDHLRGRVYVDYRGGSWAIAAVPGQASVPFNPGQPLALGAGRPGPPLHLEGAADAGLALFAPLGAARLDAGPALTRRDPYGILELPPEMISEPRSWTLRLGDPAARDLAPPRDGDRALPRRWTRHFTELAAEWTAGAATPAAALDALRRHLARGFTYTLDLPATAPGVDPTWWFLSHTRAGHCEYFASAFTLLARAAGHPARMVAGYRVIENNPLGGYALVRARDAHAWAEVWHDGAWHTYDPTPPGALGEDERRTLGPWAARWDLFKRGFGRTFERLADLSAIEILLALTLIAVLLLLWRRVRAGRRAARADDTPERWPPLARLEARLARKDLARAPAEPLDRYADRLRAAGHEDAAALVDAAAALRYGRRGDPQALAARIDAHLTR